MSLNETDAFAQAAMNVPLLDRDASGTIVTADRPFGERRLGVHINTVDIGIRRQGKELLAVAGPGNRQCGNLNTAEAD